MAYFANTFLPERELGWPPNVWAGTSVESARYLPRLDVLARVPAKVRFASFEPMLGEIETEALERCTECLQCANSPWTHSPEIPCRGMIDWAIFGGESGPGFRPMEIAWLEDAVRQCQDAGVPVFIKQDSGLRPGQQGRIPAGLWRLKESPEVTHGTP